MIQFPMKMNHSLWMLFVVLLDSCSLGNGQKLRLEDIGPVVEAKIKPSGTMLRVRGLMVSGSCFATRVQSEIRGKNILLTLWADKAKAGFSERFDVVFFAPDTINEVRFGTNQAIIWNKKQGSRHPVSVLAALRPKRNLALELSVPKENQFDRDQWIQGTLTKPVLLSVPGSLTLKNTAPRYIGW